MNNFSFVFFGSSSFSLYVLDALKAHGLLPKHIVTMSDKPQGRKLILTPNVVKVWALEHQVPATETLSDIPNADVYVVASFGKILKDEIIYRPRYKTLNVHPSLLPKLRGPAPIQGALLEENETGVSIMRLDSKMDEGPILAQEKIHFVHWPEHYSIVERLLGTAGGDLLAKTLPKWIAGTLQEITQDSSLATYTKKIKKEDADISNDAPEIALRKIRAYEIWPRARKGDLIVTDAHIENGELVVDKVIPSGKKEMLYADYNKGHK